MTQVKFLHNGDILRDTFFPKHFNNFFDSFLSEALPSVEKNIGFRPQVDILETEAHYELHVVLPGLGKEDIKVDLENNKLSISGEYKTNLEEGVKQHLKEIQKGKFSRTFNLPKNADTESISAEFKNGILQVQIGKAEPARSGRSIEIKS
jgi:HSP20 family protein